MSQSQLETVYAAAIRAAGELVCKDNSTHGISASEASTRIGSLAAMIVFSFDVQLKKLNQVSE